ncbi:hypothetical protein G5C51_18120 [Streptomyces sp. A7024]|uniref:Uncharacterized protein n=1 Tax=Streptomyces coryli TaxID=1128680 RepID=A0A6G4U143_9ACTN|nr:hypothetical protein [Streptomyces coryli]NGN65803.1 hypothetical protein [Streptomyces coryli]
MTDGAYTAYRGALRDVFAGWWVAWPLSQTVRVGEVRRLHGGGSVTAGELGKWGVEVAERTTGAPGDVTYDAGGSVSVQFKAVGGTVPGIATLLPADAGALVEFKDERSALIVYSGLRQRGLPDVAGLTDGLVRKMWRGEWDPALLVVTDVIHARAGTVLTSERDGAVAELRMTAGGAGPLQLIDLAGRVTFSRASHLGLNWTGTDITPVYRVLRVRKGWWRGFKAEYGTPQPGRGAAAEPVPELLLDEAREDPGTVLEQLDGGEQPPPGVDEAP